MRILLLFLVLTVHLSAGTSLPFFPSAVTHTLSTGGREAPPSSLPTSAASLLTTLSTADSRSQQQHPQSIQAHLENVIDLPWKHLRLSSYGPVDPEIRYVFTKRLVSLYSSSIIDCISSLLCNPKSTNNDLKYLSTIPQLAINLGSELATTPRMKLTNEEYSREIASIIDTIFNETFYLFLERNDYSQAYKIASAYGERNFTKSSDWIDLLIPKVIVKVRSLGKKCRILRAYPDLFDLEIEEATLFVNSFDTWGDELTLIFNEELMKKDSFGFILLQLFSPESFMIPLIKNVTLLLILYFLHIIIPSCSFHFLLLFRSSLLLFLDGL
jgi:hypothetical protein